MSRLSVITCDMCGQMLCGKAEDVNPMVLKIVLPLPPDASEEDKNNLTIEHDICLDCLHDLRQFVMDYRKASDNEDNSKSPLSNELGCAETTMRWNTKK